MVILAVPKNTKMRKLIFPALILIMSSCANSATDADTNAAVTDSSIHPNGMNSDAVISTDTAAYRVPDTTEKK
jgi:hypothetical protein